jgi:aldehyde dehydrogenase (NAD+)
MLARGGGTTDADWSTRILVARQSYGRHIDLITDLVRGQTIGDVRDERTQVCPVVSRAHRSCVQDFIDRGIAERGRVTTGGKPPPGQEQGWFVAPTVFADVENIATIARDEIFGTVITAIRYADDDDAIRVANDSSYGLGSTVRSADADRAVEVARHTQTGTSCMNGYRGDAGAPFGGVQANAIGREHGPDGLANYLNLKSIYLPANGTGA